jgi:hypothetical protein
MASEAREAALQASGGGGPILSTTPLSNAAALVAPERETGMPQECQSNTAVLQRTAAERIAALESQWRLTKRRQHRGGDTPGPGGTSISPADDQAVAEVAGLRGVVDVPAASAAGERPSGMGMKPYTWGAPPSPAPPGSQRDARLSSASLLAAPPLSSTSTSTSGGKQGSRIEAYTPICGNQGSASKGYQIEPPLRQGPGVSVSIQPMRPTQQPPQGSPGWPSDLQKISGVSGTAAVEHAVRVHARFGGDAVRSFGLSLAGHVAGRGASATADSPFTSALRERPASPGGGSLPQAPERPQSPLPGSPLGPRGLSPLRGLHAPVASPVPAPSVPPYGFADMYAATRRRPSPVKAGILPPSHIGPLPSMGTVIHPTYSLRGSGAGREGRHSPGRAYRAIREHTAGGRVFM